MSFTIAVIDPDGQLVAGADTLISNAGASATRIDTKIFEISPSFAILGLVPTAPSETS